ncbi:MAG: SDR family oxidoreductase [Kofleriaceae bacterium]
MKDHHVVILGGSAGIGLAVARAAAIANRVTIVSANRARLDNALSQVTATGKVCDLRDPAAIARLMPELGPIDHLVYTAGEELLLAPLDQLDLAAAHRFFELRYWGALAAIKAATVTKSIVLTSGSAGHRPHPGFLIGASICAAMEAVTRVLAIELAPVRVNCVTPGFVDTELWSNIPEAGRTQMFADAAAKLPVKRIGTPDDIAEHYLSFMRGGYVTGQHLIVDGGGVLV